jgi:hypothetical protein
MHMTTYTQGEAILSKRSVNLSSYRSFKLFLPARRARDRNEKLPEIGSPSDHRLMFGLSCEQQSYEQNAVRMSDDLRGLTDRQGSRNLTEKISVTVERIADNRLSLSLGP